MGIAIVDDLDVLVVSAVLFGASTVVGVAAVFIVLCRGPKTHSGHAQLACTVVLLISTCVYFAFNFIYIVQSYSAGYTLSSTSRCELFEYETQLRAYQDHGYLSSRVMAVALVLNITVSNAVVWWRVWILWPSNLFVHAVCISLSMGMFGCGVAACIAPTPTECNWIIVAEFIQQGRLSSTNFFQTAFFILSLLNHSIAGLLMGYEMRMKHRSLKFEWSGRYSIAVLRVLALAIEISALQCLLWVIVVTLNIFSYSSADEKSIHDLSRGGQILIQGCLVFLVAALSNIVIILHVLRLSPLERFAAQTMEDTPASVPVTSKTDKPPRRPQHSRSTISSFWESYDNLRAEHVVSLQQELIEEIQRLMWQSASHAV